MQITKKIILTILITLLIINIICTPKIFAISEIISDANNFLSESEEEMPINQENLKNTSSKVYNILLACGIAVAVVVGAVLGIIFIFSSVEGKAKIQEALLPYVVGCVVVFGAFTIWKIAITVGTETISNIGVADNEYSEEEGSKAKEYYDNKKINQLGDAEVIELFENLKKYNGEDEVDSALYNYFKEEAAKRENNIKIKEIYDNKSIDNLSDNELAEYFKILKKYALEDEVDQGLYDYFKTEIEERGNNKNS